MPHRRLLAVAAGVSILVAGLVAPAVAQERPLGPPDATPNPVALEAPAGDGTAVRLTTELGDVVIALYNESAPVAAENFLNLAKAGYYDGVGFHRAVPGFVLQGGDPDGTGMGGPGYTIPDEEVVGQYGRGTVAMARSQQPDSQGSQFFVVLDDEAQASLDAARTYAIFGQVVEGMDVVDAIVAAREPSDQIEDPVQILSASVEQVELPPEPTAAPPSAAQQAADSLAAQLPDEAAGYQLEKLAFTLDQIGAQFDPAILAELQTIADADGADAQQLAVAQATGLDDAGFISLAGASIPGVPGEQVQDAMIRLLLRGRCLDQHGDRDHRRPRGHARRSGTRSGAWRYRLRHLQRRRGLVHRLDRRGHRRGRRRAAVASTPLLPVGCLVVVPSLSSTSPCGAGRRRHWPERWNELTSSDSHAQGRSPQAWKWPVRGPVRMSCRPCTTRVGIWSSAGGSDVRAGAIAAAAPPSSADRPTRRRLDR